MGYCPEQIIVPGGTRGTIQIVSTGHDGDNKTVYCLQEVDFFNFYEDDLNFVGAHDRKVESTDSTSDDNVKRKRDDIFAQMFSQ